MIKKTSSNSLITPLIHLFRHINSRRRYQFLLMLGLTFTSSIAEVVSLGSVVPFIGILTQPEKVYNYLSLKGIAQVLNITSHSHLVLPLTIGFAFAAILAGGLRVLLLHVSIRLARGIGTDFSIEVYNRTLYQPYRVHVARSSSEIISGITQKVDSASNLLLSLVNVISSSILFLAILATLIVIDPLVASIAMLSFGTCYGIIAWTTRNRLRQNSIYISQEQTNVIKALQEGLGAIRDILLDGTQAVYCNIYRKAVIQLQKSSSENSYINQAPRYIMEPLGMVLIAFFAYTLSFSEGGISAALPILGSLALGAQRLLPLLQIFYGNWAVLQGSHATLHDVLELLNQPLPEPINQTSATPFTFQHSITFEDVRFHYNEKGPWILDGINLKIPKGSRVGFVGSTGSGKSTALDLLMSLLKPSEGKILIDNSPLSGEIQRSWQQSIAHVPQSIYLADATISENIAFGIPSQEIDLDRVKQAATHAQIANFIESHPEGYSAIVGERGVRLSGGQRQRIGIARALYKEASVLIFDEATSALDSTTESEVMEAIENLNSELTVLIIAHRVSTLKNCDLIIKIEKGKLISHGTYEHFIGSGL